LTPSPEHCGRGFPEAGGASVSSRRRFRRALAPALLLACLTGWSVLAPAASLVDAAFEPLVRRLVADGFSEAALRRLFSRSDVVFSKSTMGDKLMTLYMAKYGLRIVTEVQTRLKALGWYPGPADGRLDRMTKWSIKAYLAAVDLPAVPVANRALLDELAKTPKPAPADLKFPAFTTPEVHERMLSAARLAEAREFMAANREALARVRQRYGVPEEYLVAVLAVETRVGRYLGDRMALTNLASLAAAENLDVLAPLFDDEQPSPERRAWLTAKAREKGEWAYRELKALLRYANAQGLDPMSIPGSIYGAIGICQFMPSNALKYAVDGDGDGKADLFNTDDALMSLGNILTAMGWKTTMSDEAKRKVFFAYNHSTIYVNTLMDAAGRLRDGTASATLDK